VAYIVVPQKVQVDGPQARERLVPNSGCARRFERGLGVHGGEAGEVGEARGEGEVDVPTHEMEIAEVAGDGVDQLAVRFCRR
jgi:hypothetical protein